LSHNIKFKIDKKKIIADEIIPIIPIGTSMILKDIASIVEAT